MSKAKPRPMALRAFVTLLFAALLCALGATQAAAAPGVSATTDPANGFPNWYQDANGVRVQPCLDAADPNCIVLADAFFNPANPLVFPTNFPGEFFYQVADSDKITTPGCANQGWPALAKGAFTRVAMEGSFVTGAPILGNQITFARIRIVVKPHGLCPNTTYAFTHPYGTELVTTKADGSVPANKSGFTEDIGCLAAPCDFTLALSSRVFGGFLTWDPAVVPAAPAGYLGDAVTLHPVTGSPNNAFSIATTGGGGKVLAQTNLFTVSGKLAGPLVATPASLAFGGQNVATTSAARTVTFTNVGADPLTISGASITGPDATSFAIAPNSNTCTAAVLLRDQTCSVDVTFTPGAATPLNAQLVVTHDMFRSPLAVALSGTGTASGSVPIASVSPASLAFGDQRARTRSAAQAVTVSNTGTAPLGVSGVALAGADPGQFAVSTDTCSGRFIDPGASCSVGVVFAPTSAAAFSASLDVTDNAAGSPRSVALTGTGTGGVAAVSATTDPANGFPNWYQDENGVRVQPCLNAADPNCIVLADAFFNPANPLAFPTNFPGEFFYQVADSQKVDTPGCPAAGFPPLPGGAFTRVAMEGSFVTGAPILGNQITFARIRIVVKPNGLCPNTTYAFTHPYGTELVTTDAAGGVVANKKGFTEDIGCLTAPCDFSLALSSRVFQGFLHWDPAVAPAAPVGYLGDAVTLHEVTGSPNNAFSIATTGGTVLAQTNLFTVSGKLAGPLVATPVSLAFGGQNVNTTSAARTVTLTNIGAASLTISTPTFAGANPGDFAVTSNTCAAVVPGGTCAIGVTFTPAATGPRAARLVVGHTGPDSPVSVPLGGTGGTGAPAAGVSPLSLVFGNQLVGAASAPQTVTVTNTGTADLVVSGATFAGTNPGDFAVTSNTCAAVVPGGTCTIGVTFSPAATGVRSATLSIADNAAGSPQTVSLSGTGVPAGAPAAGVSPLSLAFGNQLVGFASAAQTVTVTNNGTADLVVSGATLAGTNPGDFTVASNTCTTTVAPGATCTIGVTFTPAATGVRSATLNIADNAAGSPQTVPLSGTGTAPAVGLSPTSLAFGNQLVGAPSAPQTVTVTNTGTADLVVSGATFAGTNPGDFTVASNTCATTVAPGAACTIGVRFSPTATGVRSATLSIADNAAGSPQTVALSGTGIQPTVRLSSTSLSFGRTAVGSTSSKTLKITNTGTGNLIFTSFSITGANPGDFTFRANDCAAKGTIPVGGKCSVDIQFQPTATGARSAVLNIVDNAPGSPRQVSLTGSGR